MKSGVGVQGVGGSQIKEWGFQRFRGGGPGVKWVMFLFIPLSYAMCDTV